MHSIKLPRLWADKLLMSVSSIGPFQTSEAPDMPDLDLVTEELSEEQESLGRVDSDLNSGDSTEDQENRGFVHVIDFIERVKSKKGLDMPLSESPRSRRNIYAADKRAYRVALKYQYYKDNEDQMRQKGIQLDLKV